MQRLARAGKAGAGFAVVADEANEEESASAPEEMKAIVDELVALAGGSKNGSRCNTQALITRPKTVTGRALSAPATRIEAVGTKMAVYQAREIKPDQIISLKAKDFRDY